MRTLHAHPEIFVTGVFDLIPSRSTAVSIHYGFHVYNSYAELLSDDNVETVINLTTISSHFEVTKRALLAGKHVYSEKPLTKSLEETKYLFALASSMGVVFQGAPCNVYSDTVRTIFKAVEEGSIGKPLLIHAELDDNPIHLMGFEKVLSPTGAPWPLEEEILEGCTYEHVGYHLVWICALLGPAVSVTAFSSELIDNKMNGLPVKVGTPDYSVACLSFACGAAARITCSVVAPRDHRMRVIGDSGEISTDGYRHYQSPVYLERFSSRSLNARKFSTLRSWPGLARLFGVGGRRLPLVRHWKSKAVESSRPAGMPLKSKMIEWLRRREVYAQDKFLGVAEMSRSVNGDGSSFLTEDFLIHINELTLMIQGAGKQGLASKPTTTFSPLGSISRFS
ncbi:Gfo/Idh/MocA family protein [Luteimonas terrae]|nr:Gfo/Idh/MocA family oxidoreductase [Luteimonas terrae]